MIRATWGWLGFRSIGIESSGQPDSAGPSHFNPLPTAGFAVRGILASSLAPREDDPVLWFAPLGTIVPQRWPASSSVPLLRSAFPRLSDRSSSLALLLFGFLFLSLGILSEYIGMTF